MTCLRPPMSSLRSRKSKIEAPKRTSQPTVAVEETVDKEVEQPGRAASQSAVEEIATTETV